jgi:hypothetical protein
MRQALLPLLLLQRAPQQLGALLQTQSLQLQMVVAALLLLAMPLPT